MFVFNFEYPLTGFTYFQFLFRNSLVCDTIDTMHTQYIHVRKNSHENKQNALFVSFEIRKKKYEEKQQQLS